MKNLKYAILTTFILLLFVNINAYSQGKHGGGHGNKREGNGNSYNEHHGNQVRNKMEKDSHYEKHENHKYNKKSSYRPQYFHNYRPIWAHHQNFNRRWVYFPQQNFYYDNWRQVYFYRSNNIWRMNVNLPSSFVVVNLEDERHYELSDEDDELDRVYINNNKHFSLFDININLK